MFWSAHSFLDPTAPPFFFFLVIGGHSCDVSLYKLVEREWEWYLVNGCGVATSARYLVHSRRRRSKETTAKGRQESADTTKKGKGKCVNASDCLRSPSPSRSLDFGVGPTNFNRRPIGGFTDLVHDLSSDGSDRSTCSPSYLPPFN